MNDDRQISVTYEREGEDVHLVGLGLTALPDLLIDYTGIPRDQRAGTATKLLCGAALYCFASTFASTMKARGAEIRALTGRATWKNGPDQYYRTKILRINIELEVDIADQDLPVLEKAKAVMEKGCLVTYTLEEAMEIEHVIRRASQG